MHEEIWYSFYLNTEGTHCCADVGTGESYRSFTRPWDGTYEVVVGDPDPYQLCAGVQVGVQLLLPLEHQSHWPRK